MSKKFFQKYFKDQTNLLAFDEKTLMSFLKSPEKFIFEIQFVEKCFIESVLSFLYNLHT